MAITFGTQFGKYVEVIIKNFVTGEKIVIPNDFHIGFNFLKTVDEVDTASVGNVVIQGLTKETIARIKSDGGEIEVRCGWMNDVVQTLFIADILRVVPTIDDSTTVLQIYCSANTLTNTFGTYKSGNYDNHSLFDIFNDIGSSIGVKIEVETTNVPKNMMNDYVEYLNTASYRFDASGTPEQIFNQINESLGFRLTTHNYDDYGRKIYVLCQTVGATNEVLQRITKGYAKTGRNFATNPKMGSGQKAQSKIYELYQTPTSQDNIALVLNKETGLLKVQSVFRIATALETQELGANETETNKSIEKRDQRNSKEAERKAKILEKGKEYKPKVKKVQTIKVNRKSLQIEALINPSIRPQGQLKIESSTDEYNGIFIARQIEFNGDNKEGEWVMKILAEDTLGKYDSLASEKDINADRENNGEIGGDLGEYDSENGEVDFNE